MTSFAGDNMRVLYPDIEPYEHGNWSFASLELELSTAVRLSEPPNINMLDSDLDLEWCVRTPDRLSSTTPPPSFARSFGTKFLALRGFALRGAGEADPPPVGLRPLPGAAPHLLQLLPSETIPAVCALVHAASPTLNPK